MAINRVAVEKTPEIRGNFIALGCPTNDVLDFGGRLLSLRRDRFLKRESFSTATRFCANYLGHASYRRPSILP
jgi:hypothetical protein